MYLVLYDSLSNKFRNELALQDTKIQNQGPRLLWYILRCITPERDGILIVKNFMSNLTQLETTLCESNWDMVKQLHDQLRECDNTGGQIANVVETTITGIYLLRSLTKTLNLLFAKPCRSSKIQHTWASLLSSGLGPGS